MSGEAEIVRFPLERVTRFEREHVAPAPGSHRRGGGRPTDRLGSVQRDGKTWRAVLAWPDGGRVRQRCKTRLAARAALEDMRAERERQFPGWEAGGPVLMRGTLGSEIAAWAKAHQLQGRSVIDESRSAYERSLAQICSLPLLTRSPAQLDEEKALEILAAEGVRNMDGRARLVALRESVAAYSVGSLMGHEVTQSLVNQIGRVYNERSNQLHAKALERAAERGRAAAPAPGNGNAAKNAWLLVQLVAWCRGLEPDDPVLRLRAKRAAPARRAEETPVITEEENQWFEQAAMETIALYPARHMAVLAVLFIRAAGCRAQEAIGLLWSDVDPEEGRVRMTMQRKWSHATNSLVAKKVKSSGRFVPLNSQMAQILELARREAAATRARFDTACPRYKRNRYTSWPSSDLVFVSKYGTTLQQQALLNAFDVVLDRARELAGIDEPVRRTTRNLRQYWSFAAAAAGVDDITAANAQGHTVEVHQAIYMKAAKGIRASDRAKFDAMFPKSLLQGS